MRWNKFYILLFILVLSFLIITPTSAWLSGFDYKKEHTINYDGSSTLNNYQVRFVFWNTTGVDSGENCYLGDHIYQADWDDLRITTTTDGICDIWIQERGTNYAIVWAEIPYIYPDFNNRVFIYYGKLVATSVSDGDATFRFWGTFEQIPLNVGKWGSAGNYTQYTYEGYSLIDIVRNATSGASRVYSLDAFAYATGYELIGRMKLDMLNATYFGFTSGTKAGYFRTDTQYANMLYTQTSDVGAPTYTNLSDTYTGWRILQIQRPPSGSYMRFLINGTSVANHTSDIPKTAMATEMSAQVVGANMTGDWLFIKRYEDPEPTHSIWESETVENAPNARFDAEPQWGYIPTTVYFSDTSTGVVSSWAWDLNGDGVVDNTTQSCSYTYTTSGSYTVELDVTNINGTSTETKTDLINIMDVPTPTPTSTPCPTGTTCPECNTTADDLVGGVGFGVVLVISVIVLTLVVGVALKMYSSVFK